MVQILLLPSETFFCVLCSAPGLPTPPPPPPLPPLFLRESISFVQHLTHCPGWLSQTWKAKAEMLSLMPDTWRRFGGDCSTGTVLPLPQSQKVPEVFPFLSTAVFVSPLLCHPTPPPACVNVGPCVGIRLIRCWNTMPIIPLIHTVLICWGNVFRPQKISEGLKSIIL